MTIELPEARRTYDAFAASYDDFNHRYRFERWTGKLLECAEAAGLRGRRLLDVGCGTGLSFISQMEAGFEITGCDISPEMLARAREKVGDRVRLVEADMRRSPVLGEFDLIWAVNDAINYLTERGDLEAALEGMRRNLARDGVIVFDVNTLATYRDFFAKEVVVERDGRRFVWRGSASEAAVSGATFEATFGGEGDGVVEHVHRQRHHPEPEVLAAIKAADLSCVRLLGELDGNLQPRLDEETHTKAVYVCRRGRSTPPFPNGFGSHRTFHPR
jgi:SAM-dependent methyltransferase